MTFITANQVAELIGSSSGRAFLRKRAYLEDNQGFPLPMPSCQSPLIWRADQIRGWAEEVGRPHSDMAVVIAGHSDVHLLEQARRA